MVEKHRKGFFDEKTGMIFESGSPSAPHVFLRFIKEKPDGSWERPSQNEGKAVKFTLEDVAYILRVLKGVATVWNTTHYFEDQKTSISFKWDKNEVLWIQVGGYSIKLNYGEIEVFNALLSHVFEEKIANSTVLPKRPEEPENVLIDLEVDGATNLVVTEEKVMPLKPEETSSLNGVVKGQTEKALLIEFEGGKEIWVPKSTIRSDYDVNLTSVQPFTIDSWILRKNNILET